MPIVFAQSIIIVPGTLAQFSHVAWLRDVANQFQPGSWVYYLTNVVLIVFFTYFYTAIIFNPVDLSENLKKQGGFIPGVKPGTRTAEYIDQVLSRVTLPGSLFLVAIAMLPYLIFDVANVPFRFGGTSLLIVVGVALDTVQQMQQHMILRQYDGFMKQGRIRFRGRQRFM
jgi:preprotein translocase subunit SecY